MRNESFSWSGKKIFFDYPGCYSYVMQRGRWTKRGYISLKSNDGGISMIPRSWSIHSFDDGESFSAVFSIVPLIESFENVWSGSVLSSIDFFGVANTWWNCGSITCMWAASLFRSKCHTAFTNRTRNFFSLSSISISADFHFSFLLIRNSRRFRHSDFEMKQ